MRKILVIMFLISMLLLITACPDPNKNATPVTIENIGWLIRNFDPGYWPDGSDSSIFITFYIYYEGDISSDNDIKNIRVENEATTFWKLESGGYELELSKKLITTNLLYDTFVDNSANRIELGNYQITLNMTDGTKIEAIRTVPAPGQTSTGSALFTYTEDYTGFDKSSGVAMLSRAIVSTPIKDATTITMNFTCDNLTENGWISFYNSAGTKIGYSDDFYDDENNRAASFINNNNGRFNSPGSNTITLSSGNISFKSGYNFSHISSFIIVLTDGKQYTKDYSFDCLSYTKEISFE